MEKPLILDSTLREGEQTPGVYFDIHNKIDIAYKLDEIGIDLIEVGHPRVSKNIYAAVKKIAKLNLNAKVGAHARSIKKDIDSAIDCGVDWVGIFYCVEDKRLEEDYKTNIDKAIEKISECISYAKKNGLIVRYTPEDTVRSSFENIIKASTAAIEAGADWISIADTTGYMVSGSNDSMYDFITLFKKEIKNNIKIAAHCHNDLGSALANALDSYRAGVGIIDTTVLGLGERAGLVDLAQLSTILKLKFNVGNWKLDKLYDLYQTVSECSGIKIPVNFPLMGKYAFTHCAGTHTNAYLINPTYYQSIDPKIFNRESNVALDQMAGMSSVKFKLDKLGLDYNEKLVYKVLEKVKEIGEKGLVSDKELIRIYNSLKIE